MNERMQGLVKWFNNQKGYGFITGSDGKEYFTHYSKILGNGFKQLMEKQPVEFEPLETPKGLTAANVEAK